MSNDVTGLLAGAAVGPGLAHTLRYGANFFVNRFLAGREKARVGLVYGLAAHKIKRRLENGERLRTDGFFEPDITERSPADEITEAILIAAQREHEERKLPYIANLLAFLAFTPGVDRAMANHLVRITSSLSYRQFCFIALANDPNRIRMHSAPNYGSTGQNEGSIILLMSEFFDIYEQRLIDSEGMAVPMVLPPIDPRAIQLPNLRLGSLGDLVYHAMSLGDIPSTEYADIVRALTDR